MKDVKSIIDNISKELEVPRDEVMKHFQRFLEEYKQKFPEKIATKKALRRVKRLVSSTVEFKGFLIGMSDLVDRVKIIKLQAKKLYENNPEEAISRGITNSDGIPLDTRTSVRGRPNPNFGLPFKEGETEYVRTIYGIVLYKNKWTPFTMTLWRDNARDIGDLELFTPYSFRAIAKDFNGKWLRINISTYTQFQPIDEKWNISEIIRTTIGTKKLSTLFKIGSTREPKIVKGIVTRIRLEPLSTGNRMLWIDDDSLTWEDEEVLCFIPPHITINFQEGSEILVVGIPRLQSRDDGDRLSINVLGIYPLNIVKQESQKQESQIEEMEAEFIQL